MADAYNTERYDDLIKRYNKQVDADTAQQIRTARSDADSKLRQAYVQNVQNQRALNHNLAQRGIRGGATQSAQLNLMNQYGANRNAINSDLSNTINAANQNAQSNKNAYALETESARSQYLENREAEDRANAREDAQINYDRQTQMLTAQYSTMYDKKKLQKALESATSDLERQIINARLGYLMAHKKGY